MIDKNTGKAVSYANIWVEKERVGVSADSDGNFFVDRKDLIGKTLIVTSVAYEKKTAVITDDIEIFLVGNINDKHVALLHEYFNKDTFHSSASIVSPKLNDVFELRKEKADSLQSSIRIGRRMFNRHHPDFFKFLVFNTILGGFFGSRLMKNIREEKGLTYGISSSMVPLASEGYWSIGADVKKENVPLALLEIQKEIDELKQQKVSEGELSLVKNYMKGSVLSSTNTVFDTMDKHKAIVHENLPKDFYDSMLEKIEHISSTDVQDMANCYMKDLSTVVVG